MGATDESARNGTAAQLDAVGDADAARPKVASAWTRAVVGLLMALAGTVILFFVQGALFNFWRYRMVESLGLTRYEAGLTGFDFLFFVLPLDLLLTMGALAVAVPLTFSSRRWPGAPRLRIVTWVVVATLMPPAILFAVLNSHSSWPLLPIALVALPPMAVLALGVWFQAWWANRDLARAYGTPEAPRS